MPLTEATRDALNRVSTATLATQLFRRGYHSVHMAGVAPANPRAERLVGEAFTLRYIPAREDLVREGAFDNRTNPQRLAIEGVEPGQVLVIDARGQTDAGTLGAILATRLMARGAAGVVTDGAVRDGAVIGALSMPVFCRAFAAPLSVEAHHPIELSVPIGCAEVAVIPGDIVVGDRDGVIVIPRGIADEVAAAAIEQEQDEDEIIARIADGAPLLGHYPPSDELVAEMRAARTRAS